MILHWKHINKQLVQGMGNPGCRGPNDSFCTPGCARVRSKHVLSLLQISSTVAIARREEQQLRVNKRKQQRCED